MLTRNFLNIMSAMPQSSSTVYGTMPVKDVYGMQYFHTNQYDRFPAVRTETPTTNEYAAGISIGSDPTPASENDCNLGRTITSGVSITVASRPLSYNGGTSLTYMLTVTNTSSAEKTIAEIGYKQVCRGAVTQGGTTSAEITVLLDRTVVDPVITLPAGQTCSITYRLATNPWEGVDNGVKIVSWQFGSDDDVAAMIDAAHNGTIDLSDHWAIGDMRTVDIGAFSSGGITHNAEKIDLVITSFDDYNGCGAVMQVDFAEALTAGAKMSESSSNFGGYAAMEIFTGTLPALANAMPGWLKSRLLPFSVSVSKGTKSEEIASVTSNKLALRSEIEVFNKTDYSYTGEGNPIGWYLSAAKMRQKRAGRTGANAVWWLRSPAKNSTSNFATIKADGSVGNSASASTTQYIAPFMCL